MNNDFLFDAIDHVPLFPSEVVVVLQVEQDLGPEVRCHVLVDEGVVGRGVAAHQLHRGPIFLAFRRIQDNQASRFNSLGRSGNWLNASLL